ncbi:MFS transporter [Helicobacter didelphidarum]|nr:MFS transporter [Helicobacter didelphidarum]
MHDKIQENLTQVGFYNRIVTYFVFFILGSGMSLWAILIPYTKERLGLNDSQLGSLLMLIGIGAMLAMAVAGKVASRIGCRYAITLCIFIDIFVLLNINYVDDIALLCVILVLMGIGVGIADVSVNIQAVFVENALNKKLMSGFHSMYSAGGFVCGMLASFMLDLGIAIQSVVFIILSAFMLLALISIKGLTTSGGESSQAKFVKPSLIVLICGFVCFVAYMSEGVFLDWSAIFLIEVKGIARESSGYGFSLFFGAITLGRLGGDYLANRFDNAKLIALSAIVAIVGLMIFLFVPHIWATYIGCIIAGLGISNVIPLIISAIPRIKGNMSLNSAIAAVTTIGYSGTLLGPALIGYISHTTSLTFALCVIVGLLFIVALVVKKLG